MSIYLRDSKKIVSDYDLGAIMSDDPDCNIVDIYLEKTAGIENKKFIGDQFHWEYVFKRLIADEYSKLTGYTISMPMGITYHVEYPYMGCFVDYWVFDSECGTNHILLCKTASLEEYNFWLNNYEGGLPNKFLYQIGYQAAITGVSRVDVAVLVDGADLKLFRYKKNISLENNLIKVAYKFWNNYVIPRKQPKPKAQSVPIYLEIDNSKPISWS